MHYQAQEQAKLKNQKTERLKIMKTTQTIVILYRDSSRWILSSFMGDIIPVRDFPTAKAARAEAKEHGWRVRRAFECDEA